MADLECRTERRNRPGTKTIVCIFIIIRLLLEELDSDWLFYYYLFNKDYYRWPEEIFEEMDSTLAVQQYIQQLIRKDFTAIDEILKAPDSQDEGVWKYEHLR